MIKILDFENNPYMGESQKIEIQYQANKIMKKLGLDQFDNLEYHHDYQYFNLSMIHHGIQLDFQLLLKEKEIYYRYTSDGIGWNNANPETKRLIAFLANQNDHNHKFYSLQAAKNYLYMILESMRA